MLRLENLISVYPFNEYEFLISSLMGYDKISLDEYYELRDDYLARNMYLYIFEISAPRTFGEAWRKGISRNSFLNWQNQRRRPIRSIQGSMTSI